MFDEKVEVPEHLRRAMEENSAWHSGLDRAKEKKAARAKVRLADLQRRELCAAYFKRIARSCVTHEDIVTQAHPLTPICGVYFLVKGNRVVYVGQSVNIVARLGTHLKEKEFDSTCYMAAEPQELDFIESFYIHALQPELNGPAPLTIERFLSLHVAEKEG